MDPNNQMPSQGQPLIPPPMLTPVTAMPPISSPAGGTSFPFWYYPEGSKTVFAAKKGTVNVSRGLIVVYDEANQEVRRIAIGPDMQMKRSLAIVNIKFINGSKTSMWDKKYIFTFYNPKLNIISFWFMLFGASKAKAFVTACKQAAGIAS
jgi:hypothetical protein